MPPPTRATTHAAYLLALVLLSAAVLVLARGEAGARTGHERLAETLASVNARALELEERALVAREAVEQQHERALVAEARLAETDAAQSAARHALYLSEYQRALGANALGRLDLATATLEGTAEEERGWEWHFVTKQLSSQVETLPAHEEMVSALAVGPHGEVLYSGADDGTVWAHAAQTGAEASSTLEDRQPREVLDEAVTALCALDLGDGARPAGRTGLVVGGDLGALVWMPARTGPSWARAELDVRITALAATRNEAGEVLVFAGCVDGTIHRWMPRVNELVLFAEHEDTVNCMRISPDGTLLASASDDERVHLTPLAEDATVPGDEPRSLWHHSDWVRSLAFDAEGRRLASAGDDGKLVVVDLETEESEVVIEFEEALVFSGFDAAGVPLAVSDGGAVLRADGTGEITLPLGQDGIVIAAASGPAKVGKSAWLAYADGGNAPRLRRAKPERRPYLSRSVGSGIRALALSDDGRLVAAGTTEGDVHLMGRAGGGWPSDVLAGHPRMVRALAFSADGTRLASAASDGSVILWDASEARELMRWPYDERVDALAFRDVAGELLVVGASGRATLFELSSGTKGRESPQAAGFLFAGLASPDGARNAWVGDAGTIRVWRAQDGERLAALRMRGVGQVEDAALPTQGPHLALISNTTAAVVLDLERGEERSRVFDGEHGFRCIAISDDGERFATGSGNGKVRVHDARTGTLLQIVRLDRNPVLALAFSGNGQRLAVGTSRGLVEIR